MRVCCCWLFPTTTYSEMVPVMVGSKILDKALSCHDYGGNLQRQPWCGDRLTPEQLCQGCCSSPVAAWIKTRQRRGQNAPLKGSDPVEVQKFWLDDVKGPVHTTQKVTILHCLALSMCGLMPVSQDTAWGFMFSQNQCLVPSCHQQWYPQLPMENYILVPQGYQSACAHLGVPVPWKYLQKPWLDRLFLPTKYHQVVHPTRITEETGNKASKGWVLEALDLQGLTEWPESEQKQARELLLKWEHLFAAQWSGPG